MALKDSRQANSSITDILFNPIVGNLMAFSTKDPNTTSSPTEFNRIVQEFIIFCYCRFCPIRNTWPAGKSVISISTNTRIADNRILSPLGKVDPVSQVIAQTDIFYH